MTKYKAKVDTYFNFSYVPAGKIIVAGDELRNSPNFECLDGKKAANTTATTGGNAEYAKALQRGKELGIPNYNRIPKEDLYAAIAEAEAKKAAPAGNADETGEPDENENNGDETSGGDENNANGNNK